MKQKRKIPLFIIDDSRAHGRGEETDFVACTSNECPMVIEVTYHSEAERQTDRDKDNPLALWEPNHNQSYWRKYLPVQHPKEAKAGDIRSLLKRAAKEFAIRNPANQVDILDITTDNIRWWLDTLEKQAVEGLRENPKDLAINTSYQIIKKIKQDYDSNFDKQQDRRGN